MHLILCFKILNSHIIHFAVQWYKKREINIILSLAFPVAFLLIQSSSYEINVCSHLFFTLIEKMLILCNDGLQSRLEMFSDHKDI